MANMRSVLAVDVGSTTTKAILFAKKHEEFRLISWAGSPTTVEKPHENVVIGVKNAVLKLEAKIGRSLLQGENVVTPQRGDIGVDTFLATSSAGGGLQMVVGGIIKAMTAESAKKAALGAGAIVMDVFSIDDGRSDLDRIKLIQQLRPDIVLLSGGIDGGNVNHVASLAEIVSLANVESRLGKTCKLPVVFAGNVVARSEVEKFLAEVAQLNHVDNLRPILEEEVLEPASKEIERLFLEHVMSQAPGYNELLQMTAGTLVPTPSAVGQMIRRLAENNEINVLGVDIGGATTDVFSSIQFVSQKLRKFSEDINWNKTVSANLVEEKRKFHRTVDANLGMSYSIGNVLAEATGANILRWIPFDIEEAELRDLLSNKMIHPTTIPQTAKDLLIEHAVAREAIRLAIMHHKMVAAGLNGVSVLRSLADDAFNQNNVNRETIIDDLQVDVFIGSGGVISHAPDRNQALMILLDAYQPVGVTELYADSIFMMPHLGLVLTQSEEKAFELLKKDCLIPLGTCVAPIGPYKVGRRIADVEVEFSDGGKEKHEIVCGQLKSIPLIAEEKAIVNVIPAYGYDCGAGIGRRVKALATGGSGGLILDGRGRPIQVPADPFSRIKQLTTWLHTVNAYPNTLLEEVNQCHCQKPNKLAAMDA